MLVKDSIHGEEATAEPKQFIEVSRWNSVQPPRGSVFGALCAVGIGYFICSYVVSRYGVSGFISGGQGPPPQDLFIPPPPVCCVQVGGMVYVVCRYGVWCMLYAGIGHNNGVQGYVVCRGMRGVQVWVMWCAGMGHNNGVQGYVVCRYGVCCVQVWGMGYVVCRYGVWSMLCAGMGYVVCRYGVRRGWRRH